jgi:Arc/MetJ family transcription regulator
MRSPLIHLDDSTFRALKCVAAKGKRSEFVRAAIRKAIREAEETRTRLAYLHQPDLEDADDWSNESMAL